MGKNNGRGSQGQGKKSEEEEKDEGKHLEMGRKRSLGKEGERGERGRLGEPVTAPEGQIRDSGLSYLLSQCQFLPHVDFIT